MSSGKITRADLLTLTDNVRIIKWLEAMQDAVFTDPAAPVVDTGFVNVQIPINENHICNYTITATTPDGTTLKLLAYKA